MNKKKLGFFMVLMFMLAFCISTTAFAAGTPDGLVKQGNATYYYQNGKMQKGWQVIEGKTYFFRKNDRWRLDVIKLEKACIILTREGFA